MPSNEGCRKQSVGFPWLRSVPRPPQQHVTLPPPPSPPPTRVGLRGMRAAEAALSEDIQRQPRALSLWNTDFPPNSPPRAEPTRSACSDTEVSEKSSLSLVFRCLPGYSPRPPGEISSDEHPPIDMGPDSLSEQNTKATSLLFLCPLQLLTLTAALGLDFPNSVDLSRGLSFRVSGSLLSLSWEVWRGVERGRRQAERKMENWRERSKASRQPCCGSHLEKCSSPPASDHSVLQGHMAWESCSFPFHSLI